MLIPNIWENKKCSKPPIRWRCCCATSARFSVQVPHTASDWADMVWHPKQVIESLPSIFNTLRKPWFSGGLDNIFEIIWELNGRLPLGGRYWQERCNSLGSTLHQTSRNQPCDMRCTSVHYAPTYWQSSLWRLLDFSSWDMGFSSTIPLPAWVEPSPSKTCRDPSEI